ncbi:MAG: thioesterase domain-containing protein [Planctomycetota bacterium]|nr:thioesterase domain-containing protein [Planctomycetota bacterium]
MKYPPAIRHTCGILHHVLRHAAAPPGVPEGFEKVVDIDILRTDDRIRSRFLSLTRSRFGRDLEEGSPDLTSIAACARRLQVIPQIQSPLSRQVLRPGVPGGGRLLMFPGMHGTVASFQRLAQFVPESMEVVGWDHFGLDEGLEIPRGLEGIVARIVEVETKKNDLDFEAPIHVFGFCIGGSIGQAVLRRIAPTGGKLIILDGHPAESVASYSRWRRSIATARAWRHALNGGVIERRLVRIGVRQLYALDRHRTERCEAELSLYRSGAPLSLGPLGAEHWEPHVRSVEEISLSNLGHVDLFRLGQEQRIVPAFASA